MTTDSIKTLRDKYFSNEIFRIGDLVEDTTTKEEMKILDRGSNYVTVATKNGIIKKWLNEVAEPTPPQPEHNVITHTVKDEFELLESGQLKMYGYETKNFDADLSTLIKEQFTEFDDLYSKHQIVKCIDLAMHEDDLDKAYSLLEKADAFYSKKDITPPFILEALKNDIERTRIVNILATVADIKPSKSNTETIKAVVKALRAKYKNKQQWDVLNPFFKIAQDLGLVGVMNLLPYAPPVSEEDTHDSIVQETLEENLDLLVDDLDESDLCEAFDEAELTEEFISEVLSLETRMKLGRKLAQRETVLTSKRARAMTKAASSSVLLSRARRLAETMLKARIFHKAPADMSRQEKERFESGAIKRRTLVARLAQRLVPKVRELQSARLHHQATPAYTVHNVTPAVVTGTNNVHASGAA